MDSPDTQPNSIKVTRPGRRSCPGDGRLRCASYGLSGASCWQSARAVPPPGASGQYHDWFRSLTVPGSPHAACCSVADCRMVESRWNSQTQHYEARVARDVFSNALEKSPLYEKDLVAFRAARQIWLSKWLASFGDVPEAWIKIPEARINRTNNPTGRAILCGQPFIRISTACSASSPSTQLPWILSIARVVRLTAVVATLNRAAFPRSPMLRASEGPSPENCPHGRPRSDTDAHGACYRPSRRCHAVAHLECDT